MSSGSPFSRNLTCLGVGAKDAVPKAILVSSYLLSDNKDLYIIENAVRDFNDRALKGDCSSILTQQLLLLCLVH